MTAQKRSERLIDVPISIEAISPEQLNRQNILSTDDLSGKVPGLGIRSDGVTRQIEIRGISNYAGNLPLVGVYLDEADVTGGVYAQLNLNTYDLERVEVLRGPQGTLYGEGSAGGTVRFITNKPNLEETAGSAEIAGLFTKGGDPSERVNAMLNVPIVPGKFAVRLVTTIDHEGGWIDQPAAGRHNINDQNLVDVRLRALWQPTETLSISGLVEISRNRRGYNTGEDADGNFLQAFGLTTTPRIRANFDIYNVTVNYEGNSFRVVNSTTLTRPVSRQQNLSFYYPTDPVTAGPVEGGYADLQRSVDIRQPTFSNELRISSPSDNRWQWTIGSFYRQFRFNIFNYYVFDSADLRPPLPADALYHANYLSQAVSFFADTRYRVTDKLTIGTGARYFIDRQEDDSLSSPQPHKVFHSFDPRVYAQYKFTNDFNIYASAAKGFRSGGFNALNQPSYGPETVWTYEIGAKSSLFDRSLQAAVSLFYSKYTDYAIQGVLPPPEPPINIVSNGGDASIKGIEWDLSWKLSTGWRVAVNGNYVSSRFTKVFVSSPTNQVGDPLNYVPKYTVNASIEHSFHAWSQPAYIQLDYDILGRETYIDRTYPATDGRTGILNIVNATFGVQLNPKLGAQLFATNVLNDRGYTDPGNALSGSSRQPPRTIGVKLDASF